MTTDSKFKIIYHLAVSRTNEASVTQRILIIAQRLASYFGDPGKFSMFFHYFFRLSQKRNFGNKYSYLSNKGLGFNKRVGWKIHPTLSTGGSGGIITLQVGWIFFFEKNKRACRLLEIKVAEANLCSNSK